MADADRVLLIAAALHVLLAVGCLTALVVEATPITGVHPALKPLKFAMSLSVLLATTAVLLPRLGIALPTQRALAYVVTGTLGIEMVLIVVQALRGTTSHFNTGTSFDTVVWRTMAAMIAIASLAFIVITVAAIVRPLGTGNAVITFAVRAGLLLFLFSLLSGFAMASRLRHSVGGDDGGPGLPVVNWSTHHGDLRVPHFIAMHALQVLPLVAIAICATTQSASVRWFTVGVVAIGFAAVAIWTFARALAGEPLLTP